MDYSLIRALPAEAYLDPSLFRIPHFDDLPSVRDGKNYERGLARSSEAWEIHIGAGGTWGSYLANGGHCSSYEGIGYHSGTAEFLRGVLDGPAALVVHRYGPPDGPTVVTTIVKPHVGFDHEFVQQRIAALQKAHGEIMTL